MVRICMPVKLPNADCLQAALTAIAILPTNAPANTTDPAHISAMTSKMWSLDQVKNLTIGFMEQTSLELREKILSHANAWGEFSCVRVRWTQTDPMIRISRGPGGYYSYLGPDCLGIPRGQHTMNLEGFTARTAESEFRRVVRHEFGHAYGCPHEHQRQDIIALLDPAKVISKFMRTQGWSEQEVRGQILVPLEEKSLTGASSADPTSIMAYEFDGDCTKSGRPIPGGSDFSALDKQYFSTIYPPDSSPLRGDVATVILLDVAGKEVGRFGK